MKPTNTAMLAWLGEDSHFKSALRRGGVAGEMARELSALDPHLRLWLAKYEVWIPERPDHALVYMVDEDAHGLGFPPRLDEVMARALEELR